ncbi:hypothetical protein BASA81_000866 [Batrachochytrium salamandrivorans]|nr:hypothetical protein BASA81_000866 [Batrachochytrium salamandrivorans]
MEEEPSSTSSPAASESNIVVALIDNNSWEVGIAEIDLANPTRLFVSQITDDRTFMTSLQRLCDIQPKEILVPDSHSARPLCEILRSAQGNKVTALTRAFFNETKGGELMNDLSKTPVQGKQHVQSHYLGRAAACALLTFVERTKGGDPIRRLTVTLDPWIEQSKRLQMDLTTIKSLELVANRKTGGREGSLLSVLKHTRTAMGGRLLRGQLISPPALLESIQGRLDAVEEIVLVNGDTGSEETAQQVQTAQAALGRMCDLDKLCSRFSLEPKGYKIRELKSEIEAVIGVRNFSVELNLLLECLSGLKQTFWCTMHQDLLVAKQVFAMLHEEIGQVTSPPVLLGGKTDHHLQDIFCVKADVDGMLDVARLAYVHAVTEMQTLVADLRESTGIGKIELKRATNRGYHLSVPRTFESRLPVAFVQAVRNKKSILCTTPELASLNNRQARLENEILALTTLRLRPLRGLISDSLAVMLRCSESVALCDMIFSFAEVSQQAGYCKPKFVEGGGMLQMDNLRHAVLETLIDDFDPRTVATMANTRLMLVTGENCSGKTTYLTQTALGVVMAQLGCFVPATKCQTMLFSRICTRLDTDDALDQNASTFSLEMMETAAILQAVELFPANKNCLVLIDELGRGTSSRDGLALSCATAEVLISHPNAMVMLSTHFLGLKQLTHEYPGRVTHVTIPSVRAASGEKEQELDENGGYGIRLAQLCGMPENVVAQASVFREQLMQHQANNNSAEVVMDPVAEVFKVLCAIQTKTKPTSEVARDYALARKLLGELRHRLI